MLKVVVVVLKVVLRKCYEIVKENACGSLRQQQQTPLSVSVTKSVLVCVLQNW